MADRSCSCGSGLPKYDLVDVRGIFCCYVCEVCEDKKKAGYRKDIFEDPAYVADDLGDDEDWPPHWSHN
jgi:hypothetical protein